MLALALMLSGPVLAASFTCAAPVESRGTDGLEELEEVFVTAGQVNARTKDLQAWLRRLVGQFSYEGHVDLCGNGNAADRRPVTGHASCIAAGSTPSVQCTVNVRWPVATGENGEPVLGGASSLLPAFVIYTLENRYIPARKVSRPGLMLAQVDNKGVAEWASGELVGDTFTSREPCVGIPGTCQKTTRITARPGSNEVSMLIDVVIENRRALRQAFLLRRESNPRNGGQRERSSP